MQHPCRRQRVRKSGRYCWQQVGYGRSRVKIGMSTHISGSVTPLTALAHSRCVFMDMIIDSVPPEVVVPAPSGLLYMRRHIETISASILRTAGKTSGCRGFETEYRSNAATIIFVSSSPPSEGIRYDEHWQSTRVTPNVRYTAPETLPSLQSALCSGSSSMRSISSRIHSALCPVGGSAR